MSPRNLYEMLVDTASRHPGSPAIEHGRECWTYRDLLARVEDLRARLLARGVAPGDRIAVMAGRDMDEPALLFAISACRAVFAPLNRLWKPPQVAYGLRLLAPRFVIAGPAQPVPDGAALIALDDLLRGPAVPAAPPPSEPSRDDLATIIFTSGSSGFPKGVMHGNSALLHWSDSTVRYLGNHPGERLLAILPLAFGYGLNQLLSMVHCGGCYRIARSVLMADVVAELAAAGITGLAGIPNFWRDFVRALPEAAAVPRLRYLTNAGGHCPVPVLRDLRRLMPAIDIVLMYGATETLRSTYLPPDLFAAKTGALGVAVPGAEVLLLDADGRPCRPGEVGEIVHRGPTVALGYFGVEESERFRPAPSWLADAAPGEKVCFTGDLARRDEDGVLWFETRRDRQLKISGFRISPSEIEDVAKELGFVEDAVAVCVKAPDRPEAIHLAVALKAGQDAPAEDEITRFLRQKVANYMVPAKVHFWRDPFPRTANGKTDHVLIERLLNPLPLKQSA